MVEIGSEMEPTESYIKREDVVMSFPPNIKIALRYRDNLQAAALVVEPEKIIKDTLVVTPSGSIYKIEPGVGIICEEHPEHIQNALNEAEEAKRRLAIYEASLEKNRNPEGEITLTGKVVFIDRNGHIIPDDTEISLS